MFLASHSTSLLIIDFDSSGEVEVEADAAEYMIYKISKKLE
jgi:hypothetical protein